MALSKMMEQYLITKDKYKDAILFYRLGDFYELFFDDAQLCSRLLELTLTGRDCGLDERAPMCGMPYHAVEPYVAKLIELGYKVAICEQMTQPTKGVKLVERDVVRVITPGTAIDSALLTEDKNNYLASVYMTANKIGVSYIDISTGNFFVTELQGEYPLNLLNDFLVQIKPNEIICNESVYEASKTLPCVINQYCPNFQCYDENYFNYLTNEKILKTQFDCKSLKTFELENKINAITSAGSLILYINETQKRVLSHINQIKYIHIEEYMQIDANTRRNLELTENNRNRKKKGSLIWLLDKTKTKMGSRLLNSFIEQPLYSEKNINYRLKGVEALIKKILVREQLSDLLYNIYDIERITGKIGYGNITPKDCLSLKNSLMLLPQIKNNLDFDATIIKDINKDIYLFDDVVELLEKAISDNSNNNLKDGGYIKKGFNAELDELNNLSSSGREIVANLEHQEKQKTNIKNLKIKFNKVFGYFIEVPNSQKELVPFNYIRKQTVANAERYITEELKDLEDKILNADEKRLKLEIELFNQIKEFLCTKISQLLVTSRAVALLDVILSFANLSVEFNYCKPILVKGNNNIEIIGGRHPVVEKILSNEDFIPNDTIFNEDCHTMVITGPNMAGKSTYMRQVALITLMAHIGCYVPAQSAKIALTDKIFTRVGASDDLSFGQSTFMVEMSEVSNIIQNATNNSLIILDEVGRGTSTYDGLSIAWAVMDYISKNLTAKTLFATHYHELTELEGLLTGVKNYRITIKEFNNNIIFLRKIVRGGANKSFGIEVAKLAGLPDNIITKAKEILSTLEQNDIAIQTNNQNDKQEINIFNSKNTVEIYGILNDLDINSLTPLNAFEILLELTKLSRK